MLPDKASGPATDLTQYSAAETLRDGPPLEIRALTPADRDELLAAIGRMSDQSSAEVLPHNTAMLRVLEKSGLRMTTTREHGVVHVELFLS